MNYYRTMAGRGGVARRTQNPFSYRKFIKMHHIIYKNIHMNGRMVRACCRTIFSLMINFQFGFAACTSAVASNSLLRRRTFAFPSEVFHVFKELKDGNGGREMQSGPKRSSQCISQQHLLRQKTKRKSASSASFIVPYKLIDMKRKYCVFMSCCCC